MSAACPRLSKKRSELPSASASTCNLVLIPPREGMRSLPGGVLSFCTGSTLRVQTILESIITQSKLGSCKDSKMLCQTFLACSATESLVERVACAEALRQIALRRAALCNPEHSVGEASVIVNSTADIAEFTGQQMFDAGKFGISEFITSHEAKILPPYLSAHSKKGLHCFPSRTANHRGIDRQKSMRL